jgi:hypothetical protein
MLFLGVVGKDVIFHNKPKYLILYNIDSQLAKDVSDMQLDSPKSISSCCFDWTVGFRSMVALDTPRWSPFDND